jgi:hypothetical protein
VDDNEEGNMIKINAISSNFIRRAAAAAAAVF